MLYQWYELGRAAVTPARVAAATGRMVFSHPLNPWAHCDVGRQAAAGCLLVERMTQCYQRPRFGIDEVTIAGRSVAVHEQTILDKPFCRLLRFARETGGGSPSCNDPKVLLVAPMSGHFATLLRGTVEALLPEHDVYITDWHDARTVPLSDGAFSLDAYIDYLLEFIGHFEGDVHVFAVCQPSVAALAAVARLEMAGTETRPHSLILAGGPIDPRISPTIVNTFAATKTSDWFRDNVIARVPLPHNGHGREVYPGFLQLAGFMGMNLERHLDAHRDLFMHLIDGNRVGVEKHQAFYDEYLAVMDLDAAFYLDTIERVFLDHDLPRGAFRHHGEPIQTGAITRTALMTIEGEKDDITGLGQCAAAHDLCTGLPDDRRAAFVAPGVGHYGIFNGSKFRREIVPRIMRFIRRHDRYRDEVADFSELDHDTAVARARGRDRAVHQVASPLQADNDEVSPGAELPAALKDASLLDEYGPTAALWTLWRFANDLMLDSFFGFEDSRRRSGSHKVVKPARKVSVGEPEPATVPRSDATLQRSRAVGGERC